MRALNEKWYSDFPGQTFLDVGRIPDVAVPHLTDTCGDFTQQNSRLKTRHMLPSTLYMGMHVGLCCIMVDNVFQTEQVFYEVCSEKI